MEAVSKNKEWLNDEALLENGIKSLSIGTENIYDKLLIYIDSIFGETSSLIGKQAKLTSF